MWIPIDLYEHVGAMTSHDGWLMVVHRMPGSSYRGVYLSIHKPDNAPYEIDPYRPPYVYADDYDINLGHALGMQLSMPKDILKADAYISLSNRISAVIWHGNPNEGISPVIKAMCAASTIRADVFVKPRGIVSISFSTEGLPDAIYAALGVRL